jgi:hypothetical protein
VLHHSHPVGRERLLQLGGSSLAMAAGLRGAAGLLMKADRGDISYVERVFARHGESVEPSIRLTTIHGAKGREADTVVVLPDMTKATYEGSLDVRRGGAAAENRVAYVAVTRTRERLVLVHPRGSMAYDYPRAAEIWTRDRGVDGTSEPVLDRFGQVLDSPEHLKTDPGQP